MTLRHLLIGGTLAVALTVAACSKATADNYAKVESGMSPQEVHTILGKPDETSGGSLGGLNLSTEKWNGSKNVITLTYMGDRVSIKRIEPRESSEETPAP